MERGLRYKLARRKRAQDYGRYGSRDEYLHALAEDYGIPYETVEMLADMLGPNEDFDGLITTLNDMDVEGEEIWAARKKKDPYLSSKKTIGYTGDVFKPGDKVRVMDDMGVIDEPFEGMEGVVKDQRGDEAQVQFDNGTVEWIIVDLLEKLAHRKKSQYDPDEQIKTAQEFGEMDVFGQIAKTLENIGMQNVEHGFSTIEWDDASHHYIFEQDGENGKITRDDGAAEYSVDVSFPGFLRAYEILKKGLLQKKSQYDPDEEEANEEFAWNAIREHFGREFPQVPEELEEAHEMWINNNPGWRDAVEQFLADLDYQEFDAWKDPHLASKQ